MFTFVERTAPTRTCDSGIISPPSLRFIIAPGGVLCFPAGPRCDRRFPSNQNSGHFCNLSVACRGCGLECEPEPPSGTPTCLPNATRWRSGTTCELCCTERSSFSLSGGSSLPLLISSALVRGSTFTCWLHCHSTF